MASVDTFRMPPAGGARRGGGAHRTTRAGRARAAATTAVAAVTVGAVAVLTVGIRFTVHSWQAVIATGPASLDDVVAAISAAVGLGLAAWLAAATTVSALAAALPATGSPDAGARLGRYAGAVAPALVRRLIAGLVGAVVAAATATPALATAPPRPPAVSACAAVTSPGIYPAPGDQLDPGWTPTAPDPAANAGARIAQAGPQDVRPRAGGGTAIASLPGPAPRSSADDELVVRRGDTLWDIAARHLGPGAGVAEIAVEWPRWYAANRHRIGTDPDHIEPGQRLVPPTPTGSAPGGHR